MSMQETPSLDEVRGVEDVERVLGADGKRVVNKRLDPFIKDINVNDVRELWSDMLVIRRIDTEGFSLQRQGQLGLWAPSRGQEASQLGSTRGFRATDFLFPSYREHGVLYARGAKPGDFTRVWRGEEGAAYGPTDFNMAPSQIIIGAQTLHATGYAMGITRDGSDEVAGVYFGDGATSQGDVNEAMVFSASYNAPVVFVCQNNQWAISEPVTVQAKHPIAGRAPAFGIPSMRVDGNDVLAVLAATRWAADHARTGNGPAFLELVTYRMGPHTTSDDPTRYRNEADVELWAQRDPIARVEAYLRSLKELDDSHLEAANEKADAVAAELRAACIGMVTRPALAVFDGVYAEPHSGIRRQRDDYAAYLDGFEGGAK